MTYFVFQISLKEGVLERWQPDCYIKRVVQAERHYSSCQLTGALEPLPKTQFNEIFRMLFCPLKYSLEITRRPKKFESVRIRRF